MLHLEDVTSLRCPVSAEPLRFRGDVIGSRLWKGELISPAGRGWAVDRGIPTLFEPFEVGNFDRGFRFIYNVIAPIHDAGVRYLLPLMQLSTERQLRAFYMDRMRLNDVADDSTEPFRILETGIGSGANIPLLAEFLPPNRKVELWGLDLSVGMMKRAVRRAEKGEGGRRVRFVLADAHHLPFPDNFFDRVFHIGAVNTFSNPKKALDEMTRVAKPQTPIVVVDERLDPHRDNGLYLRAGFRFITWYDRDPSAPIELLPPDAKWKLEQINHFFYCLTWQVD